MINGISRKNKGFTLIEMLIVIGIIGILAVGLGRLIVGAPQKARDAARKQAVGQIVQAVEAYNLDKGSYPLTVGANACTSKTPATAGTFANLLKSYFPGEKLPDDPSNTARGYNVNANDTDPPVCAAAEGFLYVRAKANQNFNYMIFAKMESSASGNLAKVNIDTDGDPILSSNITTTGEYYVVIQ